MHIIKIIHGYPPIYNAGSEVYSQSICNELSKRHKVSIFTREENPFEEDFQIRELKETENRSLYIVNKAREKDGYRHPKLDAKFGDLLDNLLPDIAHIGHLNHLSTGLVDQLRKRHIPIIFTLHDYWLMCPRGQFLQFNFGKPNFYNLCEKQDNQLCVESCYNRFFSGRESDKERDLQYWTSWIDSRMQETREIAEKTDLFIAPSRYLMQRFVNDFNIPENKIKFLDYGFPLNYLTSNISKHNKLFTFGYIGTHIPAKGIDYLIKAFANVSGACKLKIWGRKLSQETNALLQISNEINHQKKVIFMGEYINSNIADKVFAEVNCIVVPSIWAENSPLVIHEAQQCRIPVITANAGGMAEYVKHKINGYLFEHRNIADLTRIMQYALDNQDETQQIGKRGYLYSENGDVIDIKRHCVELENIYSNLKSNELKTLANNT